MDISDCSLSHSHYETQFQQTIYLQRTLCPRRADPIDPAGASAAQKHSDKLSMVGRVGLLELVDSYSDVLSFVQSLCVPPITELFVLLLTRLLRQLCYTCYKFYNNNNTNSFKTNYDIESEENFSLALARNHNTFSQPRQ